MTPRRRDWAPPAPLVAIAIAAVATVPLLRARPPRPAPAAPIAVAPPAPPREPPLAWVREAGGDARIEVRGAGGAVAAGRALHAGDAIEAGPSAPVRVGLIDDGASMTLLPGARVRFARDGLHVEQGTVRGHVGPARRRPRRMVSTNDVRAFMHDAAFTLAAQPGGARVELRQGTAEIVRLRDGARAALSPGQLVEVVPGGPLAPQPLVGEVAGASSVVALDFEGALGRRNVVGAIGRCPPGRRGRCVAAAPVEDHLLALGARISDPRGLFAWDDGLVVRFRYWVGERGGPAPPLVVWFGDVAAGRLHVLPAGEAVRGRWAQAALRLTDLDDAHTAGAAPARGDIISTMAIGTSAEGEDVLFLDDIQVQRAPR